MPDPTAQAHSTRAAAAGTAHVYDFLYHDAQRVASFLAQFDESGRGHRTQAEHEAATTTTEAKQAKVGGSLNIPVIATIEGGGETATSEAVAETLSQTYDPLWANALAFFRDLEARALLHDDVSRAAIGQFVSCTGPLTVVSTEHVQHAYQNKEQMEKQVGQIHPVTGEVKTKEAIDFDVYMFGAIRPQIQAYVYTAHGQVFSNLKPGGLITAPSHLTMNYGVTIEGTWTLIGIKDADPEGDLASVQQRLTALAQQHRESPFLLEAIQLLSRFRLMLGRPLTCYGVTPLALFRRIGR
ncbi:DUF6414 family protein [Roseospira goensis]|uniref:Uncharacterized protein n=1 Tax=Roseospira goensis TaxID=391922 RepID=A0A7W6RY40_9PROT|nr:hypothetical protein [Roseospira goensis]MBB4285363.1 hypothetical protein [Roseospira goensis]